MAPSEWLVLFNMSGWFGIYAFPYLVNLSGHRGLKRVMHGKLKETNVSIRIFSTSYSFHFQFLIPAATHHKLEEDKEHTEDPLQL